jgi:hypothetical protein
VRVNGQPLPSEPGDTVNLEGVEDKGANRFDRWAETVGAHRYTAMRDHGMSHPSSRTKETVDGYFVLADRRTTARDSRDYGSIRKASVRAVVLRVLSAGDTDASRQTALP